MPRSHATSGMPVLQLPQPRPMRGGGAATERRMVGAKEVPLDQVVPDEGQPRRDWEHGEGARRLDELVASLREFGILQPLLVYEDGTIEDGRQRYRLIAGARRRMAAERAGLSMVPVVVRDDPQTEVRVVQLIENLHRQDLSPLDEATAYQELLRIKQVSPTGLAELLHVSSQHVRDRLRLLADQILADAVLRRQISASAAREIMKLPDEEMLAFRDRVARGEVLQTNDVAAARARMAAAGVVNERRKNLPPAIQKLPTVEPVPESLQRGIPADQTVFDKVESPIATVPAPPSSNGEQHTVHDGVSSRTGAQDGTCEGLHVVPPPEAADEATDVNAEPTPSAKEVLAGIPKPMLDEVARLLTFGERVGWTCGELRAFLGLPHRKA